MTSYVYTDVEVRLTGRKAARTVSKKVHELVEVTPVDEDNGTWKKFVPMGALFEITDADPIMSSLT
jgi:hypothetical protein